MAEAAIASSTEGAAAGGSPAAAPSRASTARRWAGPVALAAIAVLGVGIMLFPLAAPWFASVEQHAELSDAAARTAQLDDRTRTAELEAAERYNAERVTGLLIDPFSDSEGVEQLDIDDDARSYLEQLSTDAAGIMARITIPRIGVDLPIFHGSTDETLRNGVGHLYGSSLPVGGDDTHAVLTGHSGLPEASLFTDLHQLESGDLIQITVLGRSLYYRVVATDTVEPNDISGLGVIDGRDMLSLVTCTPIGVNTHRLVVQAERVDPPADSSAFAAAEARPPFPWWMVLAVLAVAVIGVAVRRTVGGQHRKDRHRKGRHRKARPRKARPRNRDLAVAVPDDAELPGVSHGSADR